MRKCQKSPMKVRASMKRRRKLGRVVADLQMLQDLNIQQDLKDQNRSHHQYSRKVLAKGINLSIYKYYSRRLHSDQDNDADYKPPNHQLDVRQIYRIIS